MELANIKVQEKINMNKQLGRFENVLGEMKEIGTEFVAKCYDLGFLQSKLIKNVVCCLTEHQQIGRIHLFAVIKRKSVPGLFLFICVFLELSLLSSDVGMCTLLYNTGFLFYATSLLLLKVG